MRGHVARALAAGVHQVLGAALLTPAAAVLGLVILTDPTPARVLALWAACLPVAVLLAMTPLVRRIEVAALSELLGVDVPERADRLYLVALTSLHLYGGATLSAGVLLLSPGLTRLGDADLWRASPGEAAQVVLLALAVLAALVATGLGQRWAARRLLAGEPSRALERLGRRQSLALELHDSVGHALSVVLVQAMAAQAALQKAAQAPEQNGAHAAPWSDTDAAPQNGAQAVPRNGARAASRGTEEASRSLEHLADTARAAQQELDVLLRVLEDDGDAAESPTLDALTALTRGLDVRVSTGRLDRVPPATSRAAYAIAREALTNALRHGRGPVTLDVRVADDLVLTVENATGPRETDSREGRGLTGMRMRARLAGGTCVREEADGRWRVQATLPL
ncbi:histidine kinase [Nonomuraea roseoviolacea]|uniref:histidine kinase n=1 Tax=Nonomuraea roseoviolacea subsp. carminata TaxID=160689 RepID=A0ABT1JTR1_9ACTN|nr:histidine kinase [Nonomuraea roseoviolacea]MCP2345122.1 signal transduction histidine kinase [Nonomuraea roseoviolacea subsp. carminata]